MKINPYFPKKLPEGREAERGKERAPYDFRAADPTGGFAYDVSTGLGKNFLGNTLLGMAGGLPDPVKFASMAFPEKALKMAEKVGFRPYATKFSEFLDVDTPVGRIGTTIGSALSKMLLGTLGPIGLLTTPLSMFLGPLFGAGVEGFAEMLGYMGPNERKILADLYDLSLGKPSGYYRPSSYGLGGSSSLWDLFREIDPLSKMYERNPSFGFEPFPSEPEDFFGGGDGDGGVAPGGRSHEAPGGFGTGPGF